MKRLRYIVFAFGIVAAMLASCEKELDFNGSEDAINAMAISVVASPDTTLEAIVAQTYFFGDVDANCDPRANPYYYDLSVNKLFDSSTLKTATVKYAVNGSSPVPMKYDAEASRFRSDYRPKLGDVIEIFASAPNNPSASAKVVMPSEVSASVEIVDNYKYQQDFTLDVLETGRMDGGCDTLVDMTLQLKGIKTSEYYILKVRSYTEKIDDNGNLVYDTNECFTSTDPIFKDIRLTYPRKGWYRNFSNVFPGTAVNASEYKCRVTTRLRRGDIGKRLVEVELQTISSDLYNYLKSVMLYQVYVQLPVGDQTEAVQITSNINGGYGIAGTLVRSQKQTLVF